MEHGQLAGRIHFENDAAAAGTLGGATVVAHAVQIADGVAEQTSGIPPVGTAGEAMEHGFVTSCIQLENDATASNRRA
jgi:hypothetical protein